ncbi:HepT-like ribonuclease domain-containing protein [Ferrovum sp.]|jgi:uncharacterized protein with HEPN domain|uniref:HepT-like ribonuclease domain-containing protein n=1 Tax=Ferrovum sp. TaxID=2609467 RepID=UPI0026189670|nr:HepT-like ribonuclease domain-containing protein [Ferrovum sp.]
MKPSEALKLNRAAIRFVSGDPQRLPDYLGYILEAIERIRNYVEDIGEAGFLASNIVQDAVIRNLEAIDEASRNIERIHPAFATAHPEIQLALVNDIRNALAHNYFKVDLKVVWKAIHSDLPALYEQVQAFCRPKESTAPKMR